MIKWDEKYATGDETLDSQHKLLFEFINDLNKDILTGKSPDDLKNHLRFLSNYAKSHFCYEEACMERHQCPVAERNKGAHAQFIEFYKKYEQKVRTDGFTPESLAELHHYIETWIVQHIQKVDTQLKSCITK